VGRRHRTPCGEEESARGSKSIFEAKNETGKNQGRKGAIQMILRKTPDDANHLNRFENSAGPELERCGGEGQAGDEAFV
jgi:hypothetical protein